MIYQLPGANALDVASKIRAFMEQTSRSFPPGLEYEVSYDNTLFVRVALQEVVFTLFKALGLVMLVVFVFLGNFRATLIPCLVVPIPMVGTFAAFAALGFSINTLSLFGLVLAIGSVVDDAIVVVEAIKAHMAKGLSPLEATEKSMDEVTRPIIGVACALLAVYVPVIFLGGIVGQLYRQFALTLCFAALLSILVSLTLTPALCVKILRAKKKEGGASQRLQPRVQSAVRRHHLRLPQGDSIPDAPPDPGLVLLAAVYFGAGRLLQTLPGGLVPDEDQGVVFATFNLPPGATLERTDAVLSRAERFAAEVPGIRTVLGWGGFNLMTSSFSSDAATLVMTLAPWGERTSPETQLVAIMQGLKAGVRRLSRGAGLCLLPALHSRHGQCQRLPIHSPGPGRPHPGGALPEGPGYGGRQRRRACDRRPVQHLPGERAAGSAGDRPGKGPDPGDPLE